jgi:hypothetical protein
MKSESNYKFEEAEQGRFKQISPKNGILSYRHRNTLSKKHPETLYKGQCRRD